MEEGRTECNTLAGWGQAWCGAREEDVLRRGNVRFVSLGIDAIWNESGSE